MGGHDIVVISSIEWDFIWQSHQEISSRLARAGNRVLYIENTGVRAPALRDAARVASRLRSWTSTLRSRGVRQVEENLWVCSPLVLPPFGPAWRRRLNRRLLLPLVKRAARSLGMKRPLIWSYLPTDTAVDMARLLKPRDGVAVYYCVDDFSQLTPHLAQLESSERAMCRECDLVFAVAEDLRARCARWNPDAHLVPNGVNLDAFVLDPEEAIPQVNEDGSGCPDALRGIPAPIIGYVGGMHRHIDFELLSESARARPEWSWVYVGPLQSDVGDLKSLPNVHLLGQRPHNELARYIRFFDVCIVPYVRSPFTDVTVPTKINEYLAVGKPVVSTELSDVCTFNEEHDILLTAPAQPESFVEAIDAALSLPDDAQTLERRREVATLCDWGTLLEGMTGLVEERLRQKQGRAGRNRAAG